MFKGPMMLRIFMLIMLLFGAMPASSNDSVSFVIASTPGGATDALGRSFVDYLEKVGIKTSVENIGGAGGKIALKKIALQKNTLVIITNSYYLHVNDSSIRSKDFVPVAILAETPYYVIAKDHITCNKINSDPQFIGSGGGGITEFLAKRMHSYNDKITVVSYKGVKESVFAVMKGEVNMALVARPTEISAGQNLTILASTASSPLEKIPTMKQCFNMDISFTGQFIVLTSKNSDAEFIKKINLAVKDFVNSSESKDYYSKVKLTSKYGDLVQTKEIVDREIDKWK